MRALDISFNYEYPSSNLHAVYVARVNRKSNDDFKSDGRERIRTVLRKTDSLFHTSCVIRRRVCRS
jgi:hypothetical protein